MKAVLWPQERADLWCLGGRSQLKGMTLSLASQWVENQPFRSGKFPEHLLLGGRGCREEHSVQGKEIVLKSELGLNPGTITGCVISDKLFNFGGISVSLFVKWADREHT